VLLCGFLFSLQATTYVVNNQASNASDANAGTIAAPLKTIQAGADKAQPGDTVLVKAGIYREWVKPPRGGSSNQARIVYKAAPGENVSIRGSAQITSWVDQGNNVWLASLDNTMFGTFNPYTTIVGGGWYIAALNYNIYAGEVYLNGQALYQKNALSAVQSTANSWYTTQSGGKTAIYANFGGANPNTSLTEINARKFVIFPDVAGLGYITIDGFDIRHAADYWCYHGQTEMQGGAVGTKWGLRWIIQNNTIAYAKCNGIGIGSVSQPGSYTYSYPAAPVRMPDGSTFGHDTIRGNHITRCGQSAIYGSAGAFQCVIEKNVFDNIGYKQEFGGWERAIIKFHYPIDVIIRNNYFRVLTADNNDCPCIFFDWGAQNTRVTHNVFYCPLRTGNVVQEGSGLKFEKNHGPMLVDNNVFITMENNEWSGGGIFVHNLFVNCPAQFSLGCSNTFVAHTTTDLKSFTDCGAFIDDHWLNNIFIAKAPTCWLNSITYDYQLYLDNAPKRTETTFDAHSLSDPGTPTNWSVSQDSAHLDLTLTLSAAAVAKYCPQITASGIGKLTASNMGIEEMDGTPINIATDYYNAALNVSAIHPGPIQSIKQGSNTFKLWPQDGATGVVDPEPKRIAPPSPVAPLQAAAVYDILGHRISPPTGSSFTINGIKTGGIYIVKSSDGKHDFVDRMLVKRQ